MKSMATALFTLPVTLGTALAHQSGIAHDHPHLIWPELAAVAVLIAAVAAFYALPRLKRIKVRKGRHDPR